MTRYRIGVVLLASIMGLAACGSSSSPSPTAAPPPSSTPTPSTGSHAAPASTSAFNGGVLYVANDNGTMTAYQEGTWAQLGQWSVPGVGAGIRGTAYDNGFIYIAAGGDQASGSSKNGSIIKWNLVTNSVDPNFSETGNYGYDQLAACNGYIYLPSGEGDSGSTWNVFTEATGAHVGTISGPTAGPHNTICTTSGATTHLYLGGRCYSGGCGSSSLGQATCTAGSPCLSDNGVSVGPGQGSGGVRPFTVGKNLTRVWETWSFKRGFSIGDLTTGKILSTVDFGSYGGGTTTPSHGISVNPADTEVYVLDSPNNQVRVFPTTDNVTLSSQLAAINVSSFWGSSESCAYDCTKVSWIQHSFDGQYVFVGDSGDIINTSSRTVVKHLSDLANTRHGFIDVDWSGGKPVCGSHFGIGGGPCGSSTTPPATPTPEVVP
jgi:hypothetical protein